MTALLSLTGIACQHASDRAFVLPSLRPVDAARPMVVFSQIQGKACGPDAVLGALRDMKRLQDVDGYLEVVVQESRAGERYCAQTTAYPFRYGVSVATPVVRAAAEPTDPVLVPGRAAAAAQSGSAPASDCAEACQRYAALVATGAVGIALAKDRCEQRCKQPDQAFQQCIASARDSAAASMCSPPTER
jgi:hypothetical protein